MKKLQRLFITFSLFFFVFASGVVAQGAQGQDPVTSDPAPAAEELFIAPERILPPPESNTGNPLGQDHSYSITLRGNGEAVVDFKTVFSNFGTQPMTEIVLENPSGTVNELIAFQIIQQPKCIQYAPVPLTTSFRNPNPTELECLVYGEPDYYSYWGNTNEFVRLEPVVEGSTIRIPLDRAVEPNSAGSILLSYRSPDIVSSEFFGAYTYDFSTLQVNDKINNVQVGISTDADLVLKNAESQVNYRTAPAMDMMAREEIATGLKSQQLSTYYQEIGYGQLNKSASNMQPNETFTVTGSYAQSTFQLYAKEILIGVGVFAVILGLIVAGIIMIIRKLNSGAASKETTKTQGRTGLLNGPNILILLLTSFVTSLVLVLVIAVLIGLSQVMQYTIPWQYMQILGLFYVLLGAAITLALLVIPGLVVGYKRGIWIGISTFVGTICWMILYFILVILFMLLFSPQTPYGGPIMLREAMPIMDSIGGAEKGGTMMMEPAIEESQVQTAPAERPESVEFEQ